MEQIIITKENLKKLLTNVYNNASIATENHILNNPSVEFDLTKNAIELVEEVISSLRFNPI